MSLQMKDIYPLVLLDGIDLLNLISHDFLRHFVFEISIDKAKVKG